MITGRFRIQNFDVPAPAAGASANLVVPLMPGQAALVMMVSFSMTMAANGQPIVTMWESGYAAFPMAVWGPDAAGGTGFNVVAAYGAGNSNNPASVLAPYSCNIVLPKYVLTTNFNVSFGSAQLAGADQVTAGRVSILFGSLEDLLTV